MTKEEDFSTCDGCGEPEDKLLLLMDEKTQLSYCPKCRNIKQACQPSGDDFVKSFKATCEVAYRDCNVNQKQIQTTLNNTGLLGIEVRLAEGAESASMGLEALSVITSQKAQLAQLRTRLQKAEGKVERKDVALQSIYARHENRRKNKLGWDRITRDTAEQALEEAKGRPICPDCRDECLERATKHFESQLAALRWIPVEEGLPERPKYWGKEIEMIINGKATIQEYCGKRIGMTHYRYITLPQEGDLDE